MIYMRRARRTILIELAKEQEEVWTRAASGDQPVYKAEGADVS